MVKLTEGAITLLSTPDSSLDDLKPVLQVVDVRLLNTVNAQNQNVERFRILLSDGEYTQQGMLATQMNELVRNDTVQKGSIIQLNQFVCNIIQNRIIIIMVDLEVIVGKCDLVGEPKPYPFKLDGNVPAVTGPPVHGQPMNQPSVTSVSPSLNTGFPMSGSFPRQVGGGGSHVPHSGDDLNAGPRSYGGSFSGNMDSASARYSGFNSAPAYPRTEIASSVSRTPVNNNVRLPQSSYQQPPPMYANRGPIAKNEAPPRIIPIAALNPYQGRWTIKARVTTKSDLRHYSNTRGDGKVFSFDLLDADGGEIRVTCFNAVADQFYHQVEPGRVYMISRGTLKPAQKAFNHLRNDHEIMLDSTSTVQPCYEDDNTIPQQQFHFSPISDIEGLENNSIVDVIGVVSSISPSTSIMRKTGVETQKRTLQLKDMSGRSVELTLWGNLCNAEGQTLQNMCDSGVFPVLAVKSGRVSDFNGKSVGTLPTSKLLIEPDFPEAQKLKAWFQTDGKSTPSVSISRESNMVRTDIRKTITQIKDEKLGTSEKPDWITVSATLSFIKMENFCYTACPIMIGDRQCNKKVTNNGDGKWRCDRCDKVVDECDYRYILQMQIQDHTGLTWVTAFQESGVEIIGISAKDLYYLKYEEQDDDKFAELMRGVLFTKYLFKLKVKEETFSDEQRVKSTVIKAEKMDCQTETRYLLDSITKLKEDDAGCAIPKTESAISTPGLNNSTFGAGFRQPPTPVTNYSGPTATASRESSIPPSQLNSYGNQYGGSRVASTVSSGMYMSCSSCGSTGHNSANCPSLMSPGQSYGSSFGNKTAPGTSTGGVSGECFKCHQMGHWARDCPGAKNATPSYSSSNITPGRYGMVPKQYIGGL